MNFQRQISDKKMVFGLSKKLDKKTTVFQSFDDTSCWSGGSKSKGEDDVNDNGEGPSSPLRRSLSRMSSKMAIFSRQSVTVTRNQSLGTRDESESSSDDNDNHNFDRETCVATIKPIKSARPSLLKAPSMEFDKELGDIIDEIEDDTEIQAAVIEDACRDESETSFTETDEGGALVQLDFATSGKSGVDALQITVPEGSSNPLQLNLVGGNQSPRVNEQTEVQVLTINEKLTQESDDAEDPSDGSEIDCLPEDSFSDLVLPGNSSFDPLKSAGNATKTNNPFGQHGVLALLSSSEEEVAQSTKRRKAHSKSSNEGKRSSSKMPPLESSIRESSKKDKVNRSKSTAHEMKRPSIDCSSCSNEEKHISRSKSGVVSSEPPRSEGVSKTTSDELQDRRGSTHHRSNRPSPDKRRQSRVISADRSSSGEGKSSRPKEGSNLDSRRSHIEDPKGSRRPASKSAERSHRERPATRRPSGDAEKDAKPNSDKLSSRIREPKTKPTESNLTEGWALEEGLAMMHSMEPTLSPSQKSQTSTMVVDGNGSPSRSSPRRNPSRRSRRLSSMTPLAENIDTSDMAVANPMNRSTHSAPSATDAQSSQRLSQSLHCSPRRRISRVSRFNKPIPENDEGEKAAKPSSLFESKLLKAKVPKQAEVQNDQAIPLASTRERKVTASALRETIMIQDTEEEEPDIDERKDKKPRKSKRIVLGSKKKESKKSGDVTDS